jgi:hypothetical protein
MILPLVCLAVFAINLPFGYWRDATRKFSLSWVLAIHLPIPAVVALRVYSHIGFALLTYPLVVGSFFLGQFTGGRLRILLIRMFPDRIGSCMVMDLIRLIPRGGRS